MTLDRIQIELRLIGSATNTSLIHLRRNNATLVCLLLVQRSSHLVTHLYLRCTANLVVGIRSLSRICRTQLSLLGRRLTTTLSHIDLLAISACLRAPFYLVLDVLGLLFVGFPD